MFWLFFFPSKKFVWIYTGLQADDTSIRLHCDDKWIGVDILVTSNLKPVLKYPYYDHASDSYKSIFEKKIWHTSTHTSNRNQKRISHRSAFDIMYLKEIQDAVIAKYVSNLSQIQVDYFLENRELRAGTESVELLRMSDKGREVYVHASMTSIYLEQNTLENAKVDT